MNEQSEARLRVVGGDSAPAAPDGVPGPLRLLALLEELSGPLMSWTGTKAEIARGVGVSERAVYEYLQTLYRAGVVSWRRAGKGGRGTTYHVLVRGEAASRRVLLQPRTWSNLRGPGLPVEVTYGRAAQPSGSHNADSNEADREAIGGFDALPEGWGEGLPEGSPYTLSSSSSSSSPLPEDHRVPTGRPAGNLAPHPALTADEVNLQTLLVSMRVEPERGLVSRLMRAPVSVRNEALKRAIARKADTPEYVDECLRTAYVLEQSSKLPSVSEVYELLTGEPLELPSHHEAIDEPPDAAVEVEATPLDADWLVARGDALTDAILGALGLEG